MAWLPSSATIEYHGYEFTGPVQARYRARYVWDEAQRTIVAVRYSLGVSTMVLPDDVQPGQGVPLPARIAAGMGNLRRRLSSPGRRLTITGTGFGDLDVNKPGRGGVRDVAWGPKPEVISLEPVGGQIMWRLEWSCEFQIPECDAAKYRDAVMAFNFETTYQTPLDGLATRTYAGYLEIPQTRVNGGRRVEDDPDRYFPDVTPAVPANWERVQRVRNISKDKRRLNFSITDRMLPSQGGLPWGAVEADGTHDIESSDRAQARWSGTISANYTLAPGRPRSDAWEAFYALLSDRFDHARKAVGGRGPDSVLLTKVRATEGLYRSANRASFSAGYIFTSDLLRFITDSGMWRPVPRTDWREWGRSLGDHANPYGFAGLIQGPGDAIIDLCGGDANQVRNLVAPQRRALEGRPRVLTKNSLHGRTNWLHYDCELTVRVDTNVVRHKLVGPVLRQLVGNPGALGQFEAIKPGQQAAKPGGKLQAPGIKDPGLPADKLQHRAAPTYWVTLAGVAVRAGMRIPFPRVISVGGVDVTPLRERAGEREKANFNGVPVFVARWFFEYALPSPPDDNLVPFAPNLATGDGR